MPQPDSLELDDAAKRGAENVARACLAVGPGERVALFSFRKRPLARLLADAIEAAGGVASLTDVDDAPPKGPTLDAAIAAHVGEARASLLVAEHGIPPAVSMAILDVARRRGCRHLHLTRADVRLFAQSYRAEPERLAELNRRAIAAIREAPELRARSEGGTDLRVRLDRALPLAAYDGRPEPGRADNLPSGFVLFHPASVDGTFVADRGLVGAIRVGRDRLRGARIEVHFRAGRVERLECRDAIFRTEVETYLASHTNAARVGIVSIPTNYVVRAESGLDVQDALLPGIGVGLGYSAPDSTGAAWACPVQLRLLGRKLDVHAGARALVRAGRLAEDLVAGVDPFR